MSTRGLSEGLSEAFSDGHSDARSLPDGGSSSSGAPDPEGPAGTRLVALLRADEVAAAAGLVAGEYWNEGVAVARIERAMARSSALVGARDAQGRLVATARAVSDGARYAWIGDVCVAREWRGRGVGRAVVATLLDDPYMRDVQRVCLDTRDAQRLYASFGFVDRATERRPFPSTSMILRRP
jgi:predicted GNAT family N-acyltransferase